MASPNTQHINATGPRTESGKAISSQNALKHGLASGTILLPTEDPAEFEALLESLQQSHAPQDGTEKLLVADMAKHHWLMDRAIRLQNEALVNDDMVRFSLYLRYQTTNHRAFHKSLSTLATFKKQKSVQDKQFVSQAAQQERTEQAEYERDSEELVYGPFTNAHKLTFYTKWADRHPDVPLDSLRDTPAS